MPRRPPTDQIERLLLKLCQAVETVHAGRRLRWATVDQVHALLPIDHDQLEAAIAVAVQRGWLEAAGSPAHSVLLTASGRSALGA